jgi:hypothetical protein
MLVAIELGVVHAQSSAAPRVSVVWPEPITLLGEPLCIKIKADAISPSDYITRVQFFAQKTNPIGVVTNPPFALLWDLGSGITNYSGGPLVLTAVATDNRGLSATSAPVNVYLVIQPPFPVLKIASPENGAVFATSANTPLSAELLASLCDTGPEEFFVGTNSVGIVNTNGSNDTFSASTPLFSVTVSNLAEGSYKLGVHCLGADGGYCSCGSVNISVVKLAVVSPRLGTNGAVAFDVVTSYAGKQNVIEVSTNLLSWTPLSTNQPSASTFTFTDFLQLRAPSAFIGCRSLRNEVGGQPHPGGVPDSSQHLRCWLLAVNPSGSSFANEAARYFRRTRFWGPVGSALAGGSAEKTACAAIQCPSRLRVHRPEWRQSPRAVPILGGVP